MSFKDHRNKAEGKRIKRRMPQKEDIDTGTRVHKDKRQDEEEPIVGRCEFCDQWEELDEYGMCVVCWQEMNID